MYVHIVWFIINTFAGSFAICSNLYGAEPCSFVPAPPGKTPPCARPGLTYCENLDHYPVQIIHGLIQKWRYDHSTILSDESTEDFASNFYPTPRPVYGPPSYIPPALHPEPIHIPKPQQPFNGGDGLTYIPPKQNFTSSPAGYHYPRPHHQGQVVNYKYTQPQPTSPSLYPSTYYTPFGGPSSHRYTENDLWKRNIGEKFERLRQVLRYKRSHKTILNMIESAKYPNGTLPYTRTKRQQNLVGEQLCQSRSQFIMPKAALNNRGNWMFVVNMPEVDTKIRQLVKSEVCISNTCNGVCGLPQGYTSRCEQKYVQKRLVALEGGGETLYTDVFWFPSCCVCTISNS